MLRTEYFGVKYIRGARAPISAKKVTLQLFIIIFNLYLLRLLKLLSNDKMSNEESRVTKINYVICRKSRLRSEKTIERSVCVRVRVFTSNGKWTSETDRIREKPLLQKIS